MVPRPATHIIRRWVRGRGGTHTHARMLARSHASTPLHTPLALAPQPCQPSTAEAVLEDKLKDDSEDEEGGSSRMFDSTRG